jgi:hypothetical protein
MPGGLECIVERWRQPRLDPGPLVADHGLTKRGTVPVRPFSPILRDACFVPA